MNDYRVQIRGDIGNVLSLLETSDGCHSAVDRRQGRDRGPNNGIANEPLRMPCLADVLLAMAGRPTGLTELSRPPAREVTGVQSRKLRL